MRPIEIVVHESFFDRQVELKVNGTVILSYKPKDDLLKDIQDSVRLLTDAFHAAGLEYRVDKVLL